MIKVIRNNIWMAGLVLGLGFGLSQPASAVVIADNYVGGTPVNDPNAPADWDAIGANHFDIFNMSVSISSSNLLSVTIKSNYILGTSGTGFGDLFLASSWNPFGPSPFSSDDHSNGTLWEYGLSIDGNRKTDASGTVSLYMLNGLSNDANAVLSEDVNNNSSVFRKGQEVYVDTASNTVTDTGTNGTYTSWAAGAFNYLNFKVDLTGTSLEGDNEIGLHWTMTCANDVIEGPGVPEPGILALLAAGLLGFGFTIARRKKKQ